ncbi:signal peptidase II [Celeribacter indicus]|uniref:Lipoprotein signal peptidase n=1 Tax=Celeribacter indicus TaxID=1208324 RepID=A0A0B5DRP9_9RHOB|nr:signal peptidase II [Celeribacter indicus]AJE45719.1 lipoprotein signal peptidase [Celeribacter indicus]SDX31677.1 signal peptidase II Aspartic peptidase. MEROPS family A08 [Celeribacter indicus]
MSRVLFFGFVLLALTIDQITKGMALAWLTPFQPVPVLPGFNLTLGFNTGASFGMLSGIMANTPLLMAALTGVLTLGLAWMGLRAKLPLEAAGFALITGGSAGNILDRLRQGAVTDFLDFYWRDWHWPTFNGADIAIFLGVVAILFAGFRGSKEAKNA